MIKHILLLIALISEPLLADGVYVGGVSKHLFQKGMNENNPLLAVEVNNYIVGGFKNSYSDFTVFAAKNFNLKTFDNFSLGVMLGVTYGYDCQYESICLNNFIPVSSPYVSFTKYNIKPTVLLFGEALYFTVKINY